MVGDVCIHRHPPGFLSQHLPGTRCGVWPLGHCGRCWRGLGARKCFFGEKMEHPSPADGAVCEGTGSHILFLRLVSIRAPKAAAAGGHLRGEQCPSLGLGEKTLNLKPWREMPRVCTWCLRHPCQGVWLGCGGCFVGILSKQLSEALHFGVFLTQIDPLRRERGWRQRVPFSLGSGLPPTAIPNLHSKASPRSRCSVPTSPTRPPHNRRRKNAAERGKNGEKQKQSRRGARRGQRTAAPALKQSPDKRQMSPEEPPSVNHRRAGAARTPGAARCQHRGHPGSASPPRWRHPRGLQRHPPTPLWGLSPPWHCWGR